MDVIAKAALGLNLNRHLKGLSKIGLIGRSSPVVFIAGFQKSGTKLSFLRLSKLNKIKDFNLLIQLNSALSQTSKSLQVACEIFKLLFGY